MAEAHKTRPGWTARLFQSHAEADQHDAEFWAQIPPEQRVWELSVEQYRMAGLCADEPEFHRTVARLYRR